VQRDLGDRQSEGEPLPGRVRGVPRDAGGAAQCDRRRRSRGQKEGEGAEGAIYIYMYIEI